MNRVFLVGTVKQEPLIRYISNGSVIANIIVITEDKEVSKRFEWHSIILWDNLAKFTEEHIKPESIVCIEGCLKTRSYIQEGVKKFITEVWANDIILCSKNQVEYDNQRQTQKINRSNYKRNTYEEYNSIYDSEYYNSGLDIDQQSDEFWEDIL